LDTTRTASERSPLSCEHCGKELEVLSDDESGARLYVLCPCVPLAPGDDPELEAYVDGILDEKLARRRPRASSTEVASHRCTQCGMKLTVVRSRGSETIVAPCACRAPKLVKADPAAAASASATTAPSVPAGAPGAEPQAPRPPRFVISPAGDTPPLPAWRALVGIAVATGALAATVHIAATRARWLEPDAAGALSSTWTPMTAPGVRPDEAKAAIVQGAEATTATFDRDLEGRITRIAGNNPEMVLHAFCRQLDHPRPVVPAGLEPASPENPDLRTGTVLVKDGRGTMRSVTLVRDPATGRWSIGDGSRPIVPDEPVTAWQADSEAP
jgi:hypothetical protein